MTQSDLHPPPNNFTNLLSALDDHLPGDDSTRPGLLIISRGTSILLLLIYVAYLFFMLKTHTNLFDATAGEEDGEEEKASMSMVSAAFS